MDVVTHIAHSYETAAQSWYSYLFPIANKIFTTLAVIELAWAGIWWAIEKNEITSLFSEFLRKIIILGIFYALLIHANRWMPSIIKSFMLIGASSSKIAYLYPSDIFEQGLGIATDMISALGFQAYIHNPFAAVSVFISAYIVIIGYALVAAQIVVAQVETYLVIGAGVLLLGFSALQATRSIAVNYFTYAVNLGIRLFFLFMIVGVGSQITLHWSNIAQEKFIEDPLLCFEIIGGVFIFVYIVWVIPQKIQGLMTGIPMTTARSMGSITGLAGQVINKTREVVVQMMQKENASSHNHSIMQRLKETPYRQSTMASVIKAVLADKRKKNSPCQRWIKIFIKHNNAGMQRYSQH